MGPQPTSMIKKRHVTHAGPQPASMIKNVTLLTWGPNPTSMIKKLEKTNEQSLSYLKTDRRTRAITKDPVG